jgi:MFS family permease
MQQDEVIDETGPGPMPWPSRGKAWYAVSILVVAFVFSFIDRIVIALLVEPIKNDLGISDFGIGMLQGLAFAVFYALVGIPIGRWADRHSRRRIIGVGIFLWSIMTAVCGLTRNFWELFLARVGVGVGEAALSPAAYSMISDYFPKETLGRALGVYQAGAFLGAGIAFLIGGLVIGFVSGGGDIMVPLIGAVHPWQMVFIAVGLPGVFVALLMWTVREPARRGTAAGHANGLPLGVVLGYVRTHWRLFAAHFCGFALLAVPITTILTWVPAYYNRVLGYTPPQVGTTLGAILVILSPAGVYFGGWLVDALQKRGYPDATFRVGIGAAIILLPLSYVATSGTDPQTALYLFGPFVFCASISMAVAPAALQLVTPNQMRAQVSATWMLVLNIVTAGLGPTAVGFVTAYVLRDDQAVGSSIALVNCISLPLAAIALWTGLKHFRAAALVSAENG